jgi:hypothetical protein
MDGVRNTINPKGKKHLGEVSADEAAGKLLTRQANSLLKKVSSPCS